MVWKQSLRCWNKQFKNVLISFGLQESTVDPSLFYRVAEKDKLMVLLYVDDELVAASQKRNIDNFLKKLEMEFKVIAGPTQCFLNILINRLDDDSIFISQKTYTKDVLRRFNMEDANLVSTPIEKCQLTEEGTDIKATSAPY